MSSRARRPRRAGTARRTTAVASWLALPLALDLDSPHRSRSACLTSSARAPPEAENGRPITRHSPRAAVKRSPIRSCTGSTRGTRGRYPGRRRDVNPGEERGMVRGDGEGEEEVCDYLRGADD